MLWSAAGWSGPLEIPCPVSSAAANGSQRLRARSSLVEPVQPVITPKQGCAEADRRLSMGTRNSTEISYASSLAWRNASSRNAIGFEGRGLFVRVDEKHFNRTVWR
jgi:hypothetical protein